MCGLNNCEALYQLPLPSSSSNARHLRVIDSRASWCSISSLCTKVTYQWYYAHLNVGWLHGLILRPRLVWEWDYHTIQSVFEVESTTVYMYMYYRWQLGSLPFDLFISLVYFCLCCWQLLLKILPLFPQILHLILWASAGESGRSCVTQLLVSRGCWNLV